MSMGYDQATDIRTADTTGGEPTAAARAVGALVLAGNGVARTRPGSVVRPGARVAVYARYSSDGQTEHSVERQVRVATRYLRLIGLERFTLFADRAKSAKTVAGREELHRLLEACDKRQFDIVVLEDFDRLTREVYDAIPIAERLERADVQIHGGAVERRYSKEDIVNAALRAELDRLRRRNILNAGRFQLAERGGVPRGRLFGYKKGTVPGFLVINEEQAGVIRRIFDLAERGLSNRKIARLLVAERVIGPSGMCRWGATTIQYVLTQPMFTGWVIFGRTESRYDRESNATTVRLRAAEDVVSVYVDEYRIVDPALFLRVAEIRKGRPGPRKRHTTHLLTERVYCDCPGVTKAPFGPGEGRLTCLRSCGYGDCPASRTSLGQAEIEAAVLDAVADKLGRDDGQERFADALKRSMQEEAAAKAEERGRVERQVADVDDQLDRLLGRELQGRYEPERLDLHRAKLMKEHAELKDRLAVLRIPEPDVERAVQSLSDLESAMARVRARLPFRVVEPADADFLRAMRQILRRIEVRQTTASPGRVEIAIHLDYAAPVHGENDGTSTEVVVREVEYARSKHLHAARRARTIELLRTRESDLTDAQWDLVKDVIPDVSKSRTRGELTTRRVVDVLMAHLRSGYTPVVQKSLVPKALQNALRRFIYNGGDLILLDALGKGNSAWVEGLDLSGLEVVRRHFARLAQGPDGHTVHSRTYFLDGTTALSDAQWAVSAPCLHPSVTLPIHGVPAPEARIMIEAILLKLRSGSPWERMPRRFGPWRHLLVAARRLVYSGSWDRLIAEWRESAPILVDGLDTTAMDCHARGSRKWTSMPTPGQRSSV